MVIYIIHYVNIIMVNVIYIQKNVHYRLPHNYTNNLLIVVDGTGTKIQVEENVNSIN